MRKISIAVLALCLCFSLLSTAYAAKPAATPVNLTDIVVSIAKIASNPDLTWEQAAASLSQVRWINGLIPIGEKTVIDDITIFKIRMKEPDKFSHFAEGDITIRVSGSKSKIANDLEYWDGKWRVVIFGSKEKPKIIELVKYSEGTEEKKDIIHLEDVINTREFSIAKYKCDFKKEAFTFGNIVYRVKLKDERTLFLKNEWDCGNRGCTQGISFFMSDDFVKKIECSDD